MMTGVAFTVGALSNVFFFRDTGKIAAIAAGGGDKIIPLFLNTYLPEWFVALFMIVLIAAGMSTLSSQFHAIATAFGHDLLYNEKQSQAKQVLVSRIGVLIAFVLTFVLAYYLPMIWSQAIARGTAIFFGLCAASFLPMYTAALYSKKIKKRAAFIGMITGFVVSLFWMCFVHFKTASALGICNLILNKPYLLKGTKMPFVDPIVIALAASIIVTSILTLILKKDIDDEHIEKVFEGI
jgi:SSS family solute:Na+ symporter